MRWGRRGLRSAREALLVEEDPADGNRRSGAVQVGHQGAADLRVRGKLAQVKPAHPAGRDVPNQERPSGQAMPCQEPDQLVGRAGRLAVRVGSVVMQRRPIPRTRSVRGMIGGVGGVGQRHPSLSLRRREFEIILRADVQAARPGDALTFHEMYEKPPGFSRVPTLGTSEARLRAGGSLTNKHVQTGPPLRAPTCLEVSRSPCRSTRRRPCGGARPSPVDAPKLAALDEAPKGRAYAGRIGVHSRRLTIETASATLYP